MTRKLPNELSALRQNLTEAVRYARLAYQFNPGSYTHSTLNACLKAGRNFHAVVDATLSQKPAGPDAIQQTEHEEVLKARGTTSSEQSVVPDPAGMKTGPKVPPVTGDYRNNQCGQRWGHCDP